MHGNNTDKYRFDELRSEQWMATDAEEWDSELRHSAGVSCSSVYPADSPKLGIVLTVYSGVCYSFENTLSYMETYIMVSFYIFEMDKKYAP